MIMGVGSLEFLRICSGSSSSKHLNMQEPRNTLFFELLLKNIFLKYCRKLMKYIRRWEGKMPSNL